MTLFHQLCTSFLALFSRKSAVWHEGDQAYRDGKSEQANPYTAGAADSYCDALCRNEWRNGFYGRDGQ